MKREHGQRTAPECLFPHVSEEVGEQGAFVGRKEERARRWRAGLSRPF